MSVAPTVIANGDEAGETSHALESLLPAAVSTGMPSRTNLHKTLLDRRTNHVFGALLSLNEKCMTAWMVLHRGALLGHGGLGLLVSRYVVFALGHCLAVPLLISRSRVSYTISQTVSGKCE